MILHGLSSAGPAGKAAYGKSLQGNLKSELNGKGTYDIMIIGEE
jgi:hypothetical protein